MHELPLETSRLARSRHGAPFATLPAGRLPYQRGRRDDVLIQVTSRLSLVSVPDDPAWTSGSASEVVDVLTMTRSTTEEYRSRWMGPQRENDAVAFAALCGRTSARVSIRPQPRDDEIDKMLEGATRPDGGCHVVEAREGVSTSQP